MKTDKYAEEILKTGFVLENKVGEILRKAGWTVISNKYYEDDFEGSVREIDLVAYKVSIVQHLNIYTTLLISCKKNDQDIWALIARNINLKDPNSDWWPLHAWTNDKAVSFELSKPNMAKDYHEDQIKNGVIEALSIPECEVFAFQEMNRESGAPRNDKNIFSALTSLMKAQAYELGVLSSRKKSPSIYQFNLISVIDSDLVRLKIDKDKISQEFVESEHYISRYIIKKRETFSRIRFISAACFEKKLEDYGRLHKANCSWFNDAINNFYKDVLKDYRRYSVLIEEFRGRVKWTIGTALRMAFRINIDPAIIHVGWNKKENCAEVTLDVEENVVASLNENSKLKKEVSAYLREIYRYDGEFKFAFDDIPF